MGIVGFPVTRTELRNAIQSNLNRQNKVTEFKDNLPSNGWVDRFLKRNKISLRKPENLDLAKAQVTEAEILNWMIGFETYLGYNFLKLNILCAFVDICPFA